MPARMPAMHRSHVLEVEFEIPSIYYRSRQTLEITSKIQIKSPFVNKISFHNENE